MTTFRKNDGTPETTVWFVRSGDDLYATMPPESGKMKHIRNDTRGTPRVERVAHAIEGSTLAGFESALWEEYGVRPRLFRLFGGEGIGRSNLEIRRPDTEGA